MCLCVRVHSPEALFLPSSFVRATQIGTPYLVEALETQNGRTCLLDRHETNHETVTFYETLTACCQPGYSSGCTALAVEMYRSKCTATPMNTQFLSGNVTYYREVGLSTANQTMTTYIQADTCLATKYDSDTTFAKYTCSSNPSTPPVKLVCADAACTQCNTTATPAGATCAHGVGTNISEDNSDENAASTVPTNGVGANPVVGGAAWIVATVTALLFV